MLLFSIIFLSVLTITAAFFCFSYKAKYEKSEETLKQVDNQHNEIKSKLNLASNISSEIANQLSQIVIALNKLIQNDPDINHQRRYSSIYRGTEKSLELIGQLTKLSTDGDINSQIQTIDCKISKQKFTTLLAINDKKLYDTLSQILKNEYNIIHFDDGAKAFESIYLLTPDIIISEAMLSTLSGISFCEKIKQNINFNHIPFVLICDDTENLDYRRSALQVGVDEIIQKPVDVDLLVLRLNNLIKNRQLLKNNFSGQQLLSDKLASIEIQTPDDKLLSRIMKILNDNLSNSDLTIEQLAAEIGISRVHLHRKLKELTNQTTSDFIRNTRLSQAAKILSEGKQSINEVAACVGFDNQANFATAFKKFYGMTPREYMNRSLNKK